MKGGAAASGPIIVWLRRDLRLSDHPALHAAAASGAAVLPVYIDHGDHREDEGSAAPGAAGRWWLHGSLAALTADLQSIGSRLILRQGEALTQLLQLAAAAQASAVYWCRRYEPPLVERDANIKKQLAAAGYRVETFAGALLHEPADIVNGSGKPYRVFTPYWRACLSHGDIGNPLPPPKTLKPPRAWPESASLPDLGLLPSIPWDAVMSKTWVRGEQGALDRLRAFSKKRVDDYTTARDVPSLHGTSTLSPYLAFGEISPRQIWQAFPHTKAALKPGASAGASGGGAAAFLRQLGWRDFAYHLLYHFPDTVVAPLRPEFKQFPWQPRSPALTAWQRGRTGFPIVDAGMRELWATGWMHNRVRMLVGSFLVKDLLLPWQDGAAWFWDTLVDADLANNTLGWQWVGGCGADASPYFRIFNPLTQGEKFDGQGSYVRRWVPELAKLADAWIHQPAKAPAAALAKAGVILGKTYPHPIVDHGAARERALIAYHRMRKEQAGSGAKG